jgi:hypothetical protein
MLRQTAFSFAVGISMSFTSGAVADAPENTGDFVAYCTPFRDDCKSRVMDINIVNGYSQLSGREACTISPPKGQKKFTDSDLIEASKSIIAWLAQRPEIHGMKTLDGINRAIRALWND